ncbi:unnamed protein product [Diplocarpon coronariae]
MRLSTRHTGEYLGFKPGDLAVRTSELRNNIMTSEIPPETRTMLRRSRLVDTCVRALEATTESDSCQPGGCAISSSYAPSPSLREFSRTRSKSKCRASPCFSFFLMAVYVQAIRFLGTRAECANLGAAWLGTHSRLAPDTLTTAAENMAVAVLHAVARAAWKPVIALLGGWDWIARRFPAGEMIQAGEPTRVFRDCRKDGSEGQGPAIPSAQAVLYPSRLDRCETELHDTIFPLYDDTLPSGSKYCHGYNPHRLLRRLKILPLNTRVELPLDNDPRTARTKLEDDPSTAAPKETQGALREARAGGESIAEWRSENLALNTVVARERSGRAGSRRACAAVWESGRAKTRCRRGCDIPGAATR